MAALVAASARAGTAQGRYGQAWIVTGRGGPVLAEGPVLDELLRRDPAAALVRTATEAERLAGRPHGPP
jgi:hypothetical protein